MLAPGDEVANPLATCDEKLHAVAHDAGVPPPIARG
jgi:hypothetical protein